MFRTPAISLIILSAIFLFAGRASAQTGGPVRVEPITCSPAPCVLPPALASEGTGINVYAPIAANPEDPRQAIVGSMDGNCGLSTHIGFHVSSDAGSNWSTTCLPILTAFGQGFEPGSLPLVGYDLNGAAYIGADYEVPGPDGPLVIGIEKSTDGVTWSAPAVALGSANSLISYASLAIDQTPSSPYANGVYVLGINFAGSGQLLASSSRDGGKTWNTAQVVPFPNSASEY